MGRGKNKKKPERIPDYDWPFEISIKLNRNRPQVAFWSGVERDYYPEDPGFSKFGLTYCLPIPDDTAKPNYVPSSDLLQKPISLKGYGIGGLSAPRFAPLENEDNPAPNIYQSELVPPRVKKSERAKRAKWNDFVGQYENLVEEQYAKYVLDQQTLEHTVAAAVKSGPATPRKSMEVKAITTTAKTAVLMPDYHSSRVKRDRKKELIKLCPKKFSAFGMGFENPRFAKESLDDKIGVGTYEVNTPAMKRSFQITNPEGKLIPRVRIVCHPSGCDVCMTCNIDLHYSDYYQTINKFKILNTVDPETEGKYYMRHLSLCRHCYCNALKKGCPPWPKEKIPGTFVKARHCNCVHDHKEGHHEFLMKTTCKGMKSLARRELIYNRYFKDNPCEKTR